MLLYIVEYASILKTIFFPGNKTHGILFLHYLINNKNNGKINNNNNINNENNSNNEITPRLNRLEHSHGEQNYSFFNRPM